MPTLDLKTGTINYFVQDIPGTPYPPLLLMHGAGGQHLHWPPQIRRIPGVAVYALDLPGHGETTVPGRSSIADYVADVLAFIEALDLPPLVPVGHSMGGAISQQLALTAPERVAGLVLIGTGAKLPVTPHILDHVIDDFETVVNLAIKYSYGPTASEDLIRLGREEMGKTPPAVLEGDLIACNNFDRREHLGEIGVPALVIGGTEDKMTPLKFSEYLAEHLPDAELVVIEQSGHMISNEFPEQTGEAIKGWLEKRYG